MVKNQVQEVVFLLLIPNDNVFLAFNASNLKKFDEGWKMSDGGDIAPNDLSDIARENGSSSGVTIVNTLPADLDRNDSLNFRSRNVDYKIYVDGYLIKEFDPYIPRIAGNSYGSAFHHIPLPDDAAGKEIKEAGDLDPLNYRDDFEHHRKNYYKAELVCRETRDSVQPDEASPVDVLKEEMEEGVYETRHHGYDNALLRVNAVMEQAYKVQLSSWVDQATFNWVGPSEKKGVCHILVNDERFKWVDG